MPLEQNFAKLFRGSKFTQFQASLNQCIVKGNRLNDSYGLKRNLRYKKTPQVISVKKLDADFNQTEVSDKYWECKSLEFFENAQLQMGTDQTRNSAANYVKNVSLNQPGLVHGTYSPSTKATYVIGRMLNKCSNGYAIGVAGYVGLLPFSEIPPGMNFTISDFVHRIALTFKVKFLNVDKEGKIDLVLSLL